MDRLKDYYRKYSDTNLQMKIQFFIGFLGALFFKNIYYFIAYTLIIETILYIIRDKEKYSIVNRGICIGSYILGLIFGLVIFDCVLGSRRIIKD